MKLTKNESDKSGRNMKPETLNLNDLADSFGRKHDYLRIAITDSCNFRCMYCMPEEKISCLPSHHLMQPEEIDAITSIFINLGVKKIRLTGGEPLVRKDAAEIIQLLSKYPVELTLTTNGVLADRYISTFREAGIQSLNVSMDSLQKEKFFQVTKRDVWQKVWNNICLLLNSGFHVKVNVVMMKDINDNEILDFVELTRHLPLHVRFIEFMPFSGNRWQNKKVFTARQMLEMIESKYSFIKLKDEKHETAKKYKVLNYEGTFAVISAMSAPFCGDCNRMRLTADGKMKNCLFSKGEVDLLGAFRKGEDIVPLIIQCIKLKSPERGGQFMPAFEMTDASHIENRSMVAIGG